MNYEHLNVYKDGVLGVICINRPEVKNALNKETVEELYHALQKWEQHEGVQFIVIKGTGDEAFISGTEQTDSSHEYMQESNSPNFSAFCQALETSSKVTIAAVNGFALGDGFEVAMACDIRIANEYAVFGLLEANFETLAGTSGTHRFTKLVGKSIALNYILTGESIEANRAYQLGIVSDVTAVDELWEKVLDKVKMIRRKGPLAIQLAKLVANESQNTSLQSGMVLEKLANTLLLTTNNLRN